MTVTVAGSGLATRLSCGGAAHFAILKGEGSDADDAEQGGF